MKYVGGTKVRTLNIHEGVKRSNCGHGLNDSNFTSLVAKENLFRAFKLSLMCALAMQFLESTGRQEGGREEEATTSRVK